MNQTDASLERLTKKGDPSLILSELQQVVADSVAYTNQQIRDYNTRFCLWNGQSHDGRKWKAKMGKDPFPWEGASDARIRLADQVVNEQVDIIMAAFRRANFQVTAINAANQLSGVKVTQLLKWLFRTQCLEMCDREVELFANYRQQYGHAIMGCWWEQQRRVEMAELDLRPALAQLQNGELAPEDAQAQTTQLEQMLDPMRAPVLIAQLRESYPMLTESTAAKAAEDLRTVGFAKVPNVYVMSSLPRWEALLPFVDVFYPINTKDLQRARWVAKREWLTETELRDRAELDGWEQKWVKAALERKGQAWEGGASSYMGSWALQRTQRRSTGVPSEDYRELIEVWHITYRSVEPKSGAPVLMEDVVHFALPDQTAVHRMCGYMHQKYPYVAGVRERIDFAMTESRGVPDILSTEQDAIKVQVDARTDVTSITTCPPLAVPLWRANSTLPLGPGKQIGERRQGELRWLQPPANDGRSKEVEESARERALQYFGCWDERVHPNVSQLRMQSLVDKALVELSTLGLMTLQLAQQYLEPTTVQRVIGETVIPFNVNREEIQGQFALTLSYDTRDVNMDYVEKKLNVLNTMVLPIDRAGVIDYGNLVGLAAGCVDPTWAEQIVRSPQVATESEIEDERNQFALLFSGQEPKPPQQGQNFQLRLQVLQETLQRNPILQQIVQQRPDIAAMLEARQQQLTFQIQQQENAMIGRTGAKGGLEKVQAA